MSLKLSGGLDCKTTSGGAGFAKGYGIRLGEGYISLAIILHEREEVEKERWND